MQEQSYKNARMLSIALALSPVLSVYWIPGFSLIPLGDLLIIITSFLYLLKKQKVTVMPYAVVVFFYVFFRQLMTTSTNAEISSTAHIMLYYLFIALVLFSIKRELLYIKPVIIVSTLGSVFVVLQSVSFHLLDYYISGIIPFLRYAEHLDIIGRSIDAGLFTTTYRPRSFFPEPSMFASYAVIGLAFVLPYFGKNKRATLISIIISIGLFVSVSSTGIVLVLIMWSLFFVDRAIQGKVSAVRFGLFILIVIVSIFFILPRVFQTSFFSFVINHTVDYGLNNRIGNVARGFHENTGVIEILFGKGRVDLNYYLPEIAYVFVYWGVIGYVVFSIVAIKMFNPSSLTGKMLIVLCLSLFVIGGFMATSCTPMIYYCLRCAKYKQYSLSSKPNDNGFYFQ